MFIFQAYLIAVVVLTVFILFANALGDFTRQRFFNNFQQTLLQKIACNILTGCILISIMLALAGLAGLWRTLVMKIFLSLAVILNILWISIRLKQIKLKQPFAPARLIYWLPIIFIFALTLLNSLVPSADVDVRMYHLDLLKDYWLNGGFFKINNWEYQFFPLGFHMLYLPGEVISFPQWANFINAIAAIMLILILQQLFEAGSSTGVNAGLSLLFLYFFYTLPDVFEQSYTPRVDMPFTLYVGFLLLIIKQFNKSNEKKYLYFSSIIVGFIASIKYNGLIILAFFYFSLFVYMVCFKKLNLKDICTCTLLTILIFSPWLIKNYKYGGNPVRPLLSGLLTCAGFNVQEQINFVKATCNYVPFKRTLLNFPSNLFLFSFQPQKFCSSYISPIFISFLPFTFRCMRQGAYYCVLLCFSIIYLILWYFCSPVSRFLLPVLLIWTILIYRRVNEWHWNALKKVSIFVVVLWCVIITSNCLRQSIKKIKYITRTDQYLVENTDTYDVFRAANFIKTDKIFATYNSMNYYLRTKEMNISTLRAYGLDNLQTVSDKVDLLQQLNIGYLILDNDAAAIIMQNSAKFKLIFAGREYSMIQVL